MAAPKKARKEKLIIPNPDLQTAMRGWQPEFGNQEDLWISQRLGQLDKKLAEVDNKVLREGKDLTPRMREVLSVENGLISSINRRKMDF